MAAVAPAPAADDATKLLQNLSLDSQAKSPDAPPEVNKKASAIQDKPVDNKGAANPPKQPYRNAVTPPPQDFVDPRMCYVHNGYASPNFYYGAYNGSFTDWGDYSRHLGANGDMSHMQGLYSDMYYANYGAYPPSSPSTLGHDGSLYGTQQYQYPGPYYQPPTSSAYGPNLQSGTQNSTTVSSEKPLLSADTGKTNSNGNSVPGSVENNQHGTQRQGQQNATGGKGEGVLPGGLPFSSPQDPGVWFDRTQSPTPWLYPSSFDGQKRQVSSNYSASSLVGNGASAKTQNLSHSHFMGLQNVRPTGRGTSASGYMNRMYPSSHFYGMGFGSNFYDPRVNDHGWLTDGKYKNRGRGGFYSFGNENADGLNELNKGPRSSSNKNNQQVPSVAGTDAAKGQNLPSNAAMEESSVVPDKEQYNRADFPEKYPNAKFFVIKSYSEDDVHKSVKYNFWASTPNGNKKLDAAFREAQEIPGGCPLFLFFSVNTSGQFVGVAEMVGPVDFNRTLEYWQQDKWTGCFPVKWHIVKDVPNSLLKHIILENNENKPVTNSRDTQEVKLEQGLQLLKLFKDHEIKTSLLDDFIFYELREKIMKEKKIKKQSQKLVWGGKDGTAIIQKEVKDGEDVLRLQEPLSQLELNKPETVSVANDLKGH